MTREEALEAMARAILEAPLWPGAWEKANEVERNNARHVAEAALSSLTPLLQGVVEALEPVAAYVEVIDARDHKPLDDATMMAAMTGDKTPDGGTLFQVITAGSLRAASTAHARMKELIDG